ncbi:uncharacterized protein KRP23_3539 [Phytophthora ramorum]|uniref:uncharacterized protein n=1 Tax=Phytophthora ramorum TaxID=164328 RepID=UPI00309A4259|nr:hypothetical protein KRP23_3539 [Phytophthora ramorum]
MTSMSNIVHIYFRSSAELFVVPVATHTYSGTEPSPIKGLAMTNKRGRSLSSTDDTPLTKRAQNSETSPNTGDHQLHLQSNATSDAPVLTTAVHTESIMTESSNPIVGAPAVTIEAQEDAQQEVEAMGPEVSTVLEGNENLMPTVGLMVVAPELNVVYDSWEAFDTELKGYAKATYQLYVIRSTTSVKRRNLKIAESAARGDTTASHAALLGKGFELGGADVNVEQAAERTLIPERFQWYSKSLKCTHGWKDRHRGTGKRGSGVVRSTSCPAKMCVTLQHRGTGPDGWKVVVTKHVRTHNHQLSKELYMYYTENRRIYDPELLAVVGDGSAAATGTAASSNTLVNAHLTSLIDQANQRAGLFRILTSSEDATAQNQQQASSMAFIVAESAAPPSVSNGTTHHQLVALSEASSGNFIIRPRTRTGAPLAAMPPLGTMVLTPGTIPSKAMDGGGFCVPRVSVKVHPSWDAFHDYVAQYSFDTAQVFRTRSTVSVAARNSKILASVATKAGPDGHDVTSYASFAAASPTSRLIPEEHKWFSKLLICTYGWKRRTRSKGSRLAGEHGEAGPCPAMLLARMERNVDGEWNVVINRHVQEHNHRLNGHVEETDGRSHEAIASTGDTARALVTAPSLDSTPAQPYQSADPAVEMECETIATETSAENMAASPAEHREIVVRVPKLESVFNSWDDFHASLKSYSDSTYQLYRTRTTSSAKGRNRKISQMKRGGNDENDGDSISDPDSSGANGARKIPESWRWYSKTLTCTHGWKERNRGTGKRSAHGAGNYVAIIPANEPLALAETGFDADDDTMLYAEDTEGVWQPSSSVQIEKVASETGEVIWRVPRLVRRYPTWDAFHKYLDAYSAATFQLYRVRTTYSVKSRNTRLRQLAASRGLAVREGRNGDPRETEQEGVHGLSRAHLVPEQYEWYSKTFLCTHGWKRRSRGSGQRVSHNVRATECPAKVCATLQRIDGATAWSVVVTKHLTEHNHEISEAIYQQYSEVRRVKDPEVLAQAEQLWRGGATRRRVFEFLKEQSPNRVILMKDVHNLVQRWQSQERRPRQDHQQDDEDDEQERPSENSPVVVSASHGDESTPWL